jgi:hypothetical protein
MTLQQSSAVHIQALYPADVILPGSSSKLRLLVINLTSVPGGQLVNSPTAQSLERWLLCGQTKQFNTKVKSTIETNTDTFGEVYPKFRLLTIICIVYWIVLLLRLFSRNDLEMGDTFSFLLYCIFLLTHLLIFAATFISDKLHKGQRLIFNISIAPFILTGIVFTISVLTFLAFLLKTIFGGH